MRLHTTKGVVSCKKVKEEGEEVERMEETSQEVN